MFKPQDGILSFNEAGWHAQNEVAGVVKEVLLALRLPLIFAFQYKTAPDARHE